jgi:PAS domain S-box-containing protein
LSRTLTALRAHAGALADRAPISMFDELLSWTAKSKYAILFTDSKGRYIAANPRGLRLTGFSRLELLRKSVWDLTDKSDQTEFEPLWRAFLATGTQRGAYRLRRKSGLTLPVIYIAGAHVLKGIHASVLVPARPKKQAARSQERKSKREQG